MSKKDAFKALLESSISNDTPHFEAVGRFISSFASAEAAAHALARKLSGLTDKKARVIFGGMRLGDITDRMRGMMLADVVAEKIYTDINSCLTQLNFIADQRHKLVHRSAMYFANKLIVSNLMTAKSVENAELNVFSTTDLSAMDSDCFIIYLRLHRHADDDLVQVNEVAIQHLLTLPWQYKHEKPKSQNKQRQKVPGSQKRQRGASQE
jgi:hypothetical protein